MSKRQDHNRNLESRIKALSKENANLKEELFRLRNNNVTPNEQRDSQLIRFFHIPLHLLLIASTEGEILRINPGWYESLGYTSDEVLHTSFLDLVHPEDMEDTLKEMNKLQEGNTTFYFENRYRTKSGGYRWLVWSAIFIPEENVYYAIAHDITKRKNAEKTLQLRERILSTIIENPVNYIIYQLHRQQPGQLIQILNVSPSAKEILGIEQNDLHNYGKWLSQVHPDDYSKLREADKTASKHPFKFDLKFRYIHKRKGIRWLHVKAKGIPFEDNPASIEFVNGIIIDITEDVRKQKALKESELILESFSNEAPGVFYQFKVETDGRRKFTYVSKNVFKIIQFAPEEILNDANIFLNSIHKDDREVFERVLSDSYNNLTRYYSELRVITPSGKIKWISANAFPEKQDDGSVLWTGIGMDISEKKEAEEALRESESTLMAIFNHAPVLMMLLNEKTEIVALNETGLAYTGKNRTDAIGMRGGDLVNCIGTLNNPDGCGAGKLCTDCKVRNTVTKTLLEGVPQNKVEAEINSYSKDGKIYNLTVLVSSDIVYKENKKHVLVTIDDITERKSNETQLKLYQEHLQDLVEDRTSKLNKTNQLLKEEIEKQKEAEERVKEALEAEKELNRLKTDFVSMVSHEFRTPLTSILASADLLELTSKIKEDPRGLKHIGKIQTSVETMTHMLNDVLAISRAEKGRLIFSPVKTNVAELVTEIIEEEKSRLKSKHNVVITNNLATLEQDVDPNLLRQIVSNTVSNAIKFSGSEMPIKLILSGTVKFLELNIQDYGLGIADDEVQKIMEPFIRGRNSENIQGNGLGMTIITNAVAAHRGTFKINTQAGKGTTIIIRLPSG